MSENKDVTENLGSSVDRSNYELVIGPIEADLDGFTAEDRKEWLEDAGWRNVEIRWIE